MLLAAELRAKGGRRGGGIRECHRPPSSPRALFVHTENLNTPPSPTFHNRLSAPLFFDRLINALKTFPLLDSPSPSLLGLKRFPPFFFCRREKKKFQAISTLSFSLTSIPPLSSSLGDYFCRAASPLLPLFCSYCGIALAGAAWGRSTEQRRRRTSFASRNYGGKRRREEKGRKEPRGDVRCLEVHWAVIPSRLFKYFYFFSSSL